MKYLATLTGAALLAMGASMAGAPAALADDHALCGVDLTKAVPDATISGEITSVGFLAGVRWGEAEMKLANGETRRLDLLGLKVLETGAAKVTFNAEVFNLKNLADIEGTYYGSGTKIAIVKGDGESVINNSKCVVIKGTGKAEGVAVSAPAPGGLQISFDD